jgi:hypothetical protein
MHDSRCDHTLPHEIVIAVPRSKTRRWTRIESELLTLPVTQDIQPGNQRPFAPRLGASWRGSSIGSIRRVPITWRQDGAQLDPISQPAEPATGGPRVSRRRRSRRDRPRAYGPGLLCAPGGDRCVLRRCPRVLQFHGSARVGPAGTSASQRQAMMALRSERGRMASP